MATTKDPLDAKKKASILFMDIFKADVRLHVAGDAQMIQTLVDAVVTHGMDGGVIFQGAQLFDQLLARKAPADPLIQALLVLESRASKIGVTVRQPMALLRIAVPERAALLRSAPPSKSDFLEVIKKEEIAAATPAIIADIKRGETQRRVFSAMIVVATLGLLGFAVTHLPKGLDSVNVAFSAGTIPCKSVRTANKYLFCVVDELGLGLLNDDQIRDKMKKSQADAVKAGYKEIEFLKSGTGPDGEQHRYKPLLWQRDAKKPKDVFTGRPIGAPPPAPPKKK